MTSSVRIAVIGSGPGGLSCAGRAAERGISHVLLEAEDHVSHTIHQYQKGKHVMAEPGVLPLRSPMRFVSGKRESILLQWQEDLRRHQVSIWHSARVTAISGAKGAFEIKVAGGENLLAEHVVLCIGVQGNLRKLGVPGEDLGCVQYQLDDPDAYGGETIVVVGAGDAAVENALALAQGNRVIIINRNDEFARLKQGNLDLIQAAIRDGRVECRYGTTAIEVKVAETEGKPYCFVVQAPQSVETIACDRIIARLGATPPRKLIEGFGVSFSSAAPSALPQLSATYESNVPGLYIIGALGGYPLIKQAMNQGYEVVEYITGNLVEPADEPLLKKKFIEVAPNATVSEMLALVQRNVPLYADMSTLQLREFLLDSEIIVRRPGEVIFQANDYTNSFYSIIEGEVFVEIEDKSGKKQPRLGKGEFFGEMGLLSGRRRANTVRAGDHCVLIETPRRSMLKLISSVDSVRVQIDQTSLRRTVRMYIAPWIADDDLREMVDGAQIRNFPTGTALFMEGDAADGLHLIRRGSVTISRQIGGKEIVLSYLAAGNYVGEMALLSDVPRTATVRAAVNTETILLQAKVFNDVLSRNPTLRDGVQARALERLSQNVKREAEPDPGNLISFLINQGLGEATDVLLIDEGLCIRCDQCEKACADTHDGTSRLDRQAGPTFANIHVPTSCRHCENPRCMTDCPPDALHRNANGEVYIDNTCIGCGNCQRNCPYGVIQMGPADSRPPPSSLWSWLLLGVGAEPGRGHRAVDKNQAKKAVKCDMCKDLSGGPACVRACPTGAALRVSPEQFLDSAGK